MTNARKWCGVLAMVVGPLAWGAEMQPWTPQRSVETTYYVGSQSEPWSWLSAQEPIVRSPDGDAFFFVTRRGDLACDCTVFDLKVFSSAEIAGLLAQADSGLPRATREFTMSSASNYAAIGSARWSQGGRSIAFLGAKDRQAPQVYTLDVQRGSLSQLTDQPLGVDAFDAQGGSVVYLARTSKRKREELLEYPVNVVEGAGFSAALGLEYEVSWSIYSSYRGGKPRELAGPTTTPPAWARFWLSPDGERAIVTTAVTPSAAPRSWRAYKSASEPSSQGRDERMPTFRQLSVVDMKSGRLRPVVDAPTGLGVGNPDPDTDVLWGKDSGHVLIINTALPLGPNGAQVCAGAPSDERTHTSYVVYVDLIDERCETVLDIPSVEGHARSVFRLAQVKWTRPGQELLAVFQSRSSSAAAPTRMTKLFTRTESGWIGREVSPESSPEISPDEESVGRGAKLSNGISVSLRQDANSPPGVIASDGKRETWIVPPDARLETVRRSTVNAVSWRDRDDRRWEAGLLLPDEGQRPFPLVIQLTSHDPSLFLPDGPGSTAFAAQSLANRGMAVLLLPHHDAAGYTTSREGPSVVEGLDSAVEYLSAEGLIDRERVGLIGFSRTGFLTNYALTNPGRIRLAAAVSADWGDPSYVQYVAWSLIPLVRSVVGQYEQMYGSGTFWENKARWLAHAPGFNADRVQAPVLLTINGYGGTHNVATGIEFYASLRLNARPVELLFFPEGEHQLKRPRERLASMQATVDWMSFWLQDHEDAVPAKRAQYERWRVLRQQRDAMARHAYLGSEAPAAPRP